MTVTHLRVAKDDIPDLRQCRVCGVAKTLDSFHRRSRSSVERHTQCKACHSERAKALYVADRDRILAQKRDYYARTLDKQRASGRAKHYRDRIASVQRAVAWREANPDRVRENDRAWRTANRDRVIALRAQRRGALGDASQRDLGRTLRRFGDCCVYCGSEWEQWDHVVPVSRGGTNFIGNLVPVCLPCNVRKSDSLLVEWRYRGKLKRHAA